MQNKDFRYALILGIIIGVFLIPLEFNTFTGDVASKSHLVSVLSKHAGLVYLATIIGFPILALIGLAVAKLLFSKVPAIWQFVKFGLVGVSNTAINFGVLNGLVAASGVVKGWPLYFFESIAFVCALFNSYIWNSHWSFENKNKRTTEEFVEFFLITFVGSQVNSLIVFSISSYVHPLGGISQKLWINVANVIATLAVMFWNFFGFKLVVFRDRSKEMANPQKPA